MRNPHLHGTPNLPLHKTGKAGKKGCVQTQSQAPSLNALVPPDLPMQQNMALFEFNGQSGYLLKHEFMRRLDKQFNPFSVDRIDVVVATTLSITARPRGGQVAWRAGVLRRKTQELHRSIPNPLLDILETSAPASLCSSKLPWKLPPPQHWRLPLGPHGNQGEALRLGWGRGEEWAE